MLKNFPTRYLHEPWTAPETIQRSAKCIIGVDYPKPMVNHAFVSRINMERMKQVYTQLGQYRQTGQVINKFNIIHIIQTLYKRCAQNRIQGPLWGAIVVVLYWYRYLSLVPNPSKKERKSENDNVKKTQKIKGHRFHRHARCP